MHASCTLIAWPERPKNATPSCTSDGFGECFSSMTSASGCPDPSTGTAPFKFMDAWVLTTFLRKAL